jgi:hypothetical protein
MMTVPRTLVELSRPQTGTGPRSCEATVTTEPDYVLRSIVNAYQRMIEAELEELARPTLLERGPLSAAAIFQAARDKGCYRMRNGSTVHVKPGCQCPGGPA